MPEPFIADAVYLQSSILRDHGFTPAVALVGEDHAPFAPLSPLPTVVVPWRGEMGGAVLVLPTPRQWVRFALWARRRMQPQENTP